MKLNEFLEKHKNEHVKLSIRGYGWLTTWGYIHLRTLSSEILNTEIVNVDSDNYLDNLLLPYKVYKILIKNDGGLK